MRPAIFPPSPIKYRSTKVPAPQKETIQYICSPPEAKVASGINAPLSWETRRWDRALLREIRVIDLGYSSPHFMSRAFLFLSILPSICDAGVQSTANSKNLAQCLEYALSNSFALNEARMDEEKNRWFYREIVSGGLPKIEADVNFTQNYVIQQNFIQDFVSPNIYGVLKETSLLPQETPVPEPTTFPAAFGTEFNSRLNLNLKFPILDVSYLYALRGKKSLENLKAEQVEMVRIAVIENVAKAFYQVIVSKEELEAATRNLQGIETLLLETQSMYKEGFAEQIDAHRVKMQLNNLKRLVRSRVNQIGASLGILKFHMGMPQETELFLDGNLNSVEFTPLQQDPQPIDLENRIEIRSLKTIRDLRQLDAKRTLSRYYPTLDLTLNYGYSGGTNEFDDLVKFEENTWFDYSNIGFALRIPIFNGLSTHYAYQQNKIELTILDNTIQQTKNDMQRSLDTADASFQASLLDMKAGKENMDLGENIYKVSVVKYQEGVGSNLEVVEASTALRQSQTDYYLAVYQAIIARIDLLKSKGILSVESLVP